MKTKIGDCINRPVVLVNSRCGISSFTTHTVGKLITKHGYGIQTIGTEIYKGKKNPYYIDGMDTIGLLKKTFDEVPNICTKLPIRLFNDEKLIPLLKQYNSRVCFIDRENLLDIAVCTFKDFKNPPKSKKKFEMETTTEDENLFREWRDSPTRLHSKISPPPARIIKYMKKLQEDRQRKQDYMECVGNKQKKFISAEKLCSFDVNEYARVFEILGFRVEFSILNEHFSDMQVREKYKHANVIHKEDIDELKESLKKHNFLKYWR